MKNCLIYTRNLEEDNLAEHQGQEARCRRQIAEIGVNPANAMILRDYGRPECSTRPGLNALCTLVKDGHVQVVAMEDFDVLADSGDQGASLLQVFNDAGAIPIINGRPLTPESESSQRPVEPSTHMALRIRVAATKRKIRRQMHLDFTRV